MAIDKALYQAPQGLDALTDMPQIEIEMEPEVEITELEVSIGPEEIEGGDEFDANLAEYLDESTLEELASELTGDFDDDIGSRKDWMQTYVDGLELLGMKIEERTEPWEGACGVYHPLLSEALEIGRAHV